MKDVLANQSDTVQFNAAVILNDQKVPLPSTGIQIMMDVVKNKNEWTEFRGTAIRILGNQEALPPQAFFLFEDALADQDDEVQLSAALALTDQKVPLPSTSIQMLLEVVKNKNEEWTEFRAAAISALGRQEELPPQALSVLEDALTDQDDDVQFNATLALSDQKVPLPSTGIQIMMDAVKNENEGWAKSRAAAISVLGRQEKLSLPALFVLEDVLQDEDKEVKAEAAIALGMHTTLSTVCMEVLLEILKDSEYDQNDKLRAISILNAEETLSPDAVSVLTSTLQDKDEKVSEASS